MKEKNEETLRAVLTLLPEYAPPTNVWENLDLALNTDAFLRESARHLPLHEPPDGLWERMVEQLPTAPVVARRLILWQRYAAAAVLVGILFGAWWLLIPISHTEEQISVTQEILDPQVAATVLEKEEQAFEWVNNLCASKAPICEQSEFKSLKIELDELTTAKLQIHAALGQYGDDPELANQLVKIELSRTQVLQEIMQMI